MPSVGDGVDVVTENMLQPPTAGFLSHSASASPLDETSLVNVDQFASSVVDMSNSPGSTTRIQQSSQDRPILPAKQTPSSASTSSADSVTNLPIKHRNNKRPRQEPTAIDSGHGSSSTHSAQDSEEERILEKRRRNTLAARRFRKRKQDHIADLEARLAAVTKERDELRLQVAKWEGEVMALRKLLERRG
ncbi:hypothetical protein VTN77DRAFT_1947 [Rasamsonia byssochlamydoides]|uniref:uncharacterized protein n=1 Tax=Rasamsonia byssochlamydoides TaxID=89139 RepID=UPI003742A329